MCLYFFFLFYNTSTELSSFPCSFKGYLLPGLEIIHFCQIVALLLKNRDVFARLLAASPELVEVQLFGNSPSPQARNRAWSSFFSFSPWMWHYMLHPSDMLLTFHYCLLVWNQGRVEPGNLEGSSQEQSRDERAWTVPTVQAPFQPNPNWCSKACQSQPNGLWLSVEETRPPLTVRPYVLHPYLTSESDDINRAAEELQGQVLTGVILIGTQAFSGWLTIPFWQICLGKC